MKKADSGAGVDQRVIKAIGHPLRMTLLSRLTSTVASPSDLAQELGEPLANVSYHINILRELECIELVETTPRRGALEHYYRATERPLLSDDNWAELPLVVRRSVFDAILRQLWDDVRDRAEAKDFGQPEAHVSRTPLVLDEQGWRAAADVLAKALERILQIEAESAGRLAGAGAEESIDALVGILQFERRPVKARRRSGAGKKRSRRAS